MTQSGRGVAVQLELTGAASLIGKAASFGLRKLVEAGVSDHTLFCLNVIAEKCPISEEYRGELTRCRQKQKQQSTWIFDAIEIGTGTNPIADLLLENRAGENVLGLLSTIYTVVSAKTCYGIVINLFKECGAALEHIPSLKQLGTLRDSLLPLARAAEFGDQVFGYAQLFQGLLEATGVKDRPYIYASIPNQETVSKVMMSLSQLMQEDSSWIFEYHGFEGSAWVAAYARHVLGLPVCIFDSPTSTIPIHGEFRTARVLIHVYSEDRCAKLLVRGEAQDVFVPHAVERDGCEGWLINAERTNVLHSYIPDTPRLRDAISFIVASMAKDYITKLMRKFGDHQYHNSSEEEEKSGLITYCSYCLPAVLRRAQAIMAILGFREASIDLSECDDWRQFIFTTKTCDPFYGVGEYASMGPGKAWLDFDLGHFERTCPKKQPKLCRTNKDDEIDRCSPNPEFHFDTVAQKHMAFIFDVVETISWLALTDWEQRLRTLRVDCFRNQEPFRTWRLSFAGLLSLRDLCHKIIDITVGARRSWTQDFKNSEMLAFHHSGVIFCNGTSLSPAFNLDACFIHLYCGSMLLDGQRHEIMVAHGNPRLSLKKHNPEIRSDSASESIPGTGPASDSLDILKPENKYPRLAVTNHIDLSGDSIIITRFVEIENRLLVIEPPGMIFVNLVWSYVTRTCNHSYYAEFQETRTDGIYFDNYPFDCENRTTEMDECKDKDMRLNISIPRVDQNPAGQLLSIPKDLEYGDIVSIVQRDCCLRCTCERLRAEVSRRQEAARGEERSRNTKIFHRIIFGRAPGEEMK